jgi:pimeloyl-ACP methyl ester carboxylesterase
VPEVRRDGVRIHYETRGQGPPVLMIMGLGVSAAGWRMQVDALQGDFRLILPDNRGAGHSDAPPGPYTMEQYAADALAVLDQERVASAHVVGISMGGMIAQRLALTAPTRMRSLGLLATHGGGPTSVPTAAALGIFRQMGRGPEPDERFELMGRLLYAGDFFEENRASLHQAMKDTVLATKIDLAAWRAQVGAITRHLTLHQLRRLRGFPTLVATGAEDLAVRPINSRILASAIPGARHVQWAGVGHGCNVQAAEAVNAELRLLFARGESRG